MPKAQPLIEIEGVESSARVREKLRDEGRPVLLAFSGGKDAIAAWLALRDDGVPVVPCYLYLVPGLKFVDDTMDYFEDYFGTRIARMPHPSLFRWLNNLVFQAPERIDTIEAAGLPNVEYRDIWEAVAEDHGLDASTWVADGVRAADSIVRRVSFKTHGVMKPSNRKVSPVWDYRKAHVYEAIEGANIRLPVDYEWFGRSFDGLDYRFLKPLHDNAPDDFARILEWFPLAELELIRHGL